MNDGMIHTQNIDLFLKDRPDESQHKNRLTLLIFLLFFIVFFAFTARLPFFWDRDILLSRIAHYFLENGFNASLPVDMDPGYPPALSYLLAIVWTFTGKSLWIAHLIMLVFTLGLVYQTWMLLDYLFGGRYLVPAMIIVFANTILLSQTVMYSTDLVMLFFLILAVNAMIRHHKMLFSLAIIGLLFTHNRGFTIAAALGIFELIRHRKTMNMAVFFNILWPYLPGLMLFAAWSVFHYTSSGWLFYHQGSPWAPCFELVDLKGFIRNSAILVWRLIDFGMLFLWLIPGIFFLYLIRKKSAADPVIHFLVILLLCLLIFIIPAMLVYRIMNSHRYLLPFFYFLSVLAAYILLHSPAFRKTRKLLFTIVVVGMVSGNFWIYPDHIAKGWDSSLAHLPYHSLRKKMIDYLDDHNIPVEKTGSEAPNLVPFEYVDLSNDFRTFARADLSKHQYVFYSNVYNTFTDNELNILKNTWHVEAEYRCIQVKVILYRNPEEGEKPLVSLHRPHDLIKN